MVIGLGILHIIDANPKTNIDIIPIDYCTNSIICSAWEVARRRFKEPIIYNYSISANNPINWGRLADYHSEVQGKEASINTVWYQTAVFASQNPIIYAIQYIFLNMIKAIIFDSLLMITNRKPR